MSRLQIAQRMHRISEVRERQARSAVEAAVATVDATQAELVEIETEHLSSEERLFGGDRVISGAWIHVLASARDFTRQEMDRVERDLVSAEELLAERRSNHQESARRMVARGEVKDRVRMEWKDELRKSADKELDDLVNARSARSLLEL